MVDYKFGDSSLTNMEMLDEIAIKILRLALLESTIDFSVISGYRTAKEQHELYMKGLSDADGYTEKSAHQSGVAFDVVPYMPGVDVWDVTNGEAAKAWLEIARSIMRAGRLCGAEIEWGLTYNFGDEHDYPHFQINNWVKLNQRDT